MSLAHLLPEKHWLNRCIIEPMSFHITLVPLTAMFYKMCGMRSVLHIVIKKITFMLLLLN